MQDKFMQKFALLLLSLSIAICMPLLDVQAKTKSSNKALRSENKIEIQINGVPREIRDNIKLRLSLNKLKHERYLSNKNIYDLYNKSVKEVKEAIEPFGYYEPEVSSKLDIELGNNKNSDRWIASYDIKLGEPIIVDSIQLKISGKGAQDSSFNDITHLIKLEKGEILNHVKYEETKEQILSYVVDHGYLKAKWTNKEILVNRKEKKCNINLELDSGNTYHFGQVTFNETILKQDLLLKYVQFNPGDTFSPSKIIKLQSNLSESRYFDSIKIEQLVSKNNNIVPIHINLEPLKKNQFLIGAGYETDEQLRFSAAWNRRYFNDSGHSLSSRIYASKQRFSFLSKYAIPGVDPLTTKYNIAAELENTALTDTLLNNSIAVYLEKSIKTEHIEKYLRLNYTYVIDEMFYNNHKINPKPDRHHLLYGETSLNRIELFKKNGMHKGVQIGGNLKLGVNNTISGENPAPDATGITNLFAQFCLKGKLLNSFGKKSSILLSATAGITFPKENNLSDKLLFFAGGDNSIRGYNYNSIGVYTTIENEVVTKAANYLLLLGAEYRHKLNDSLSAIIFVDSGTATNTFAEKLKVGVGAGIMWKIASDDSLKLSISMPLIDLDGGPKLENYKINLNFEKYF